MLTALMCFAGFFFMYVESAMDMKFPQLYLVFGPMYIQGNIWTSMFIGIVQAWVFEFFASRFSSLIVFDWQTMEFKFEESKEKQYRSLEDVVKISESSSGTEKNGSRIVAVSPVGS